jgi:dihydrodipicolinate synthase/N-acetylneuraminate lyase
MTLRGVIPPLGTPLKGNNEVDEAGLRRLNRYLLGAGVDVIFANGTMGGFAFLTDDEQIRSVSTSISEVNGAVPVMAGMGETSTSRAVRMAKRLAAEGPDVISLLPPYYFLATQEHLYAYFCEIAAAVDLPIMLYDNPVLTKNPIHPETIARLAREIPHLIGVKVSNSDQANLQSVLTLTKSRPGFSVLTGHEFLIVVGLQMGCGGFVGGLHNLCPHIAVGLWRAFQKGDIALATKLQQDLIATWQLFRCCDIWGAFDEALRYLGMCERATGAPYVTPVSETERAKIHSILDQYVKPYLEMQVAQ